MANEEHVNILKESVETWNEWRKRRPSLRDADLRGADLALTNLRFADLSEAYLREASLRYTNLMGADLSGANLKDADLRGADLSEADLREADLREANLAKANLSGADLTRAICGNTHFSGLDLSTVKGLESIRHEGPSYVDIYTLYASQGTVPEVFLRGCGVPEGFITFLPALTAVKIGEKVPRMIRLKIPRTNNRKAGQLLLLGR